MICIFMIALGGGSQCQREHCYELDVQFDQKAQIKVEDPVFYDNGIVGEIRRLNNNDNNLIATICINDSIDIALNAEVHAGYMPAFGNHGIKIFSANDGPFAKSGDLLQGTIKDTIDFSFPSIDSAIFEKAIEVMTEMSKKKD